MRFSSRAVATQIERNVAEYDAGRISFEEFDARQKAAWDAVAKGELRVAGSACSRRHTRVLKRLGFAA